MWPPPRADHMRPASVAIAIHHLSHLSPVLMLVHLIHSMDLFININSDSVTPSGLGPWQKDSGEVDRPSGV